jgi:hypothetical protein
VVSDYDAADTGMRNTALAAPRQLGSRGRAATAGAGSLIDEINHTPPAMPGNQRPITCQLAATRHLTQIAQPLPGI